MREIIERVYTFDELSDEAKEKACRVAAASGIPMAVVQLLDSKKYDVMSVEVLNS